jgi:RNA polymerase sigma factor (sigma-70 family)
MSRSQASQASEVIQHVRRILLREGGEATDGQLLERFIQGREEAALEALVKRHGPMVWGVCRRILRNHHDAEDAFQATFLVLVRRAACVVPREMLANWLHGVAYQTALKGRAMAAKRQAREKQLPRLPERPTAPPPVTADWEDWLDRELIGLPEKYRSVLVQCELECKTVKETAHSLGIPEGTVSGRLARAKVMLAKRLVRRGVVLPGAGLATAVASSAATAGMPAALEYSTIKAAMLFGAGQSAATALNGSCGNAVLLAEGVLKMMMASKLKSLAVALLTLLLVPAFVVGLWSAQSAAERGPNQPAANNVEVNEIQVNANQPDQAGGGKQPKKKKPAEDALNDLPGFANSNYKVDPYIHAAAFLQAMGKDKARARLTEVARDEKRRESVIVLCRMLFARKPGGEFRRPELGKATFLGNTNSADWPLEPIELVDGVPFLIVDGYKPSNRVDRPPWQYNEPFDYRGAEQAEAYLKYCFDRCHWSDVVFKAQDEQAKENALKKLLASPKWKATSRDYLILAHLGLKMQLSPWKSEAIVTDWKAAGAEVGWLHLYSDGSLPQFVPETEGKPGDLPAFRFNNWTDGLLTKLPVPAQAFGLSLSNIQAVTDAGLKELAGLKSLQSLILDNNPVTDAGLDELAGLKNLRTLDLRETRVTDAGLQKLAALPSLQALSLGATRTTDGGLKHLARLKTLQVLDLSGTKVTDAGLKELSGLKALQILDLRGTQVTGLGLKELAGLESLHTLDLAGTNVADTGLKEVARLKNLRWLDLHRTQVTDAGLKELAGQKNLQLLYLGGTRVTDAGLKELACLKSLKALYLVGTQVTDAGLEELRKALPACDISR